jgi:outer membrane protein OmpA-like peptidoglycan-associated protein
MLAIRNGLLKRLFTAAACSILFGATAVVAQQINVAPEESTVAGRSAMAVSYPEGPTISVKFKGTHRLPKASGEAKVERKRGMTEIEIELDEMKPAAYFGGDFATYALWVVSPEGQVDNVGEFILRGNRSKLNVSTPQQTFALFVTAEPHFLATTPSRFVVLENTHPTHNLTGQMLSTSTIKYRGYEGAYNFRQETLLTEPETKGETRSDVRQAIVAVKLAERAGAQEFAAAELAKARQALERTLEADEANVDPKQLMVLGHETVRLSVEAEKLSRERSFAAALQGERDQRSQEISSLKVSIEKAASDAERARLEQQRKALELEIERNARANAQARADESARLAADEARKREAAEKQAQQLALDKLSAEQKAAELDKARAAAAMSAEMSKNEAERIRQERDEAKKRLQTALGAIVETRTTARGIIVNLPDILFDVDRATLKPQAKETISRICGILQVAGEYNLSIEGHTDNTGSDEYNQALSEKRAQSVYEYLAGCGLRSDHLASKGLGESTPLDTNDTAQGRQKNRRVEIVIENQPGIAQTTPPRQ